MFVSLQSWVLFLHLLHNKIALQLKASNNNIHLLKIDKPQLNTEMLKVKVIHT